MSAILNFFKENVACDILLVLGLLAWYITYIGAPRASKKSGHHVSGIPAVGGILIILAFLTSSVKWLAFIGLLEPGLLYLLFSVLPGYFKFKKELKKWAPPEELEGGRVVAYSSYNKEYETLREKQDDSPAMLTHYINWYIITAAGEEFRLIGREDSGRTFLLSKHSSAVACKNAASARAKWTEV